MTSVLRLSLGLGLATLAAMAVLNLPTLMESAASLPLLACKMAEIFSGLWG